MDQEAEALRSELAEVHKDKTSGVSIAPVDESKCAHAMTSAWLDSAQQLAPARVVCRAVRLTSAYLSPFQRYCRSSGSPYEGGRFEVDVVVPPNCGLLLICRRSS
jgi:ubiquitin-protein ligase